jgi:hypothetical protein
VWFLVRKVELYYGKYKGILATDNMVQLKRYYGSATGSPVTDNPASTSAANSDQSQSAGDDANAAIKFGPKKLPYIQPLEAISHGTHQEGRNDPSCARPSVPDNKMPGSFPDEPGNKASRDIILNSVTHYRLLACESHFSTKIGAGPRRIL